jgi:hypothetical protein
MNDSEPRLITSAELLRDEALAMALLALNNAHARELSWIEAERLEYLVREAFLARRIGKVDAFLLAFDQDARYDSAPGTTASSARSTQFHQTPLRMPSMPRWALSRSAPPASMTEAGRFATCRKPYRTDLTPRAQSRGISPPRP